MAGFVGLIQASNRLTKSAPKKFLDEVIKSADENLIKESRVKYANFRANWYGTVNSPSSSYKFTQQNMPGTLTVPQYSPPTPIELSRLNPALAAKFGQTVYITNNTPYGRKLNAEDSTLDVAAAKTAAEFRNKS